MSHPIIRHLANLKFYNSYKKSPAKSFDQYLKFMDSGAPKDFQWSKVEGIPLVDEFKFDDPFLGDNVDSETEEAVEKFLEQQRQKEPELDLDDWYDAVEFHLDYLLKKYEVIQECLDDWNLKDGKVSNEKLAEMTGLSKKTVDKYSRLHFKAQKDIINKNV